MEEFDAIIFDMDGTLWDATDSYVECWNIAAARANFPAKADRPMLESVMVRPKRRLMNFCFQESKSRRYKR